MVVVVEEEEVDGDVATRGGVSCLCAPTHAASAAPRCTAAAATAGTRPHVRFQESFFRGGRADSEGEESPGTPDTEGSSEGSRPPPAARHTAIYRPFVDKALKQMGLRKLIMRLHRLLDGSLRRARDALMPEVHGEQDSELALGGSPQDYLPELLERLTLQECAAAPPGEGGEGEEGEEGDGGGEAGRQLLAELERMGLPSFRPAYLVLCRILLNVVHECLKLRLEQRPAGEPSLLSVKQLVRECKEVIKGGLIVKQYYQLMTHSVLEGEQPEPEQDIDEFEDDLQKMLTVYYEYIQSWISMLQHLPQASYGLKNLLEEEWGFSKQVVPLVRGGEAQAGTLFCDIARELLQSTGDFLRHGARRLCSELHVSPNDSVQSDGIRRSVIETCRAVKELFHEARERASKALGFAKMLKKDLGLAAEFVLSSSVDELLHLLATSGHVKVLLEDLEPVQVFVPAPLGEHRPLVLQLLSAACGRDCSGLEGPAAAGGYLLLLRPRGGAGAEWCGRTMRVSLTTETINTLQDVQVCSLLLVALHSGVLQEQRKAFQRVACYAVRLHSEQTSTRPAIAHALEALKVEALGLCDTISGSIEEVNARFVQEAEGDMEEVERYSMQQYYKETMIQAFNFGFEYHKEVVRLMSGESRQRVGDHFISFARKWMEYVLSKCESGRGTRPRWATQGFEFITAIEPAFISALPEEDFVSLQTLINSCILHVIGKPHSPGVAIHRNSPRPISVPRCHSDPPCDDRDVACAACPRVLSLSEGDRLSSLSCEPFKSLSRHSSPTEEREEPSFPRGEPLVVATSTPVRRSWELTGFVNEAKEESSRCGRMERVRKAMARFEQKLDAQSQRRRVVGRVCSTPHAINNLMHVGLRKVTFKWQRGNKIGEGQYGKVYTCVNVDTGELMAMKEIRFQPNDHKTIKETADEIKIFEGINHSNLVRYYGVELHREEMYIFMEYCDEGTLEEVSRLGLQEPVIRHYTKQICTAITELHERGIVHRDIKGANIFLTSTGHIKLGDFGCSVKLKNISQTMPGEVNSTLGTAAYMAPEVITRARGEGHGRAADIWSLGCVLIEMATGKRPWHEYEHNFQIMYRVGMGHKPPLPERLSPEGRDFLALCLESDPSDRCTASQLLDHAFVKVCLDQDEI
ncbi:unnamed protein product [Lampetra planeri]